MENRNFFSQLFRAKQFSFNSSVILKMENFKGNEKFGKFQKSEVKLLFNCWEGYNF